MMNSKVKDITGEKFGKLTVIKFSHIKKYRSNWECLCECGNTKIVATPNLRNGDTKSCGCLKKEKAYTRNKNKDRETQLAKELYFALKQRQKKFNGDILDFENFKNKIKKPCVYCGEEYSIEKQERFRYNSRPSNTIIKVNGLDRVNSNIGYTDENTVPCCTTCNLAKNTMSVDKFKKWIEKVYNNMLVKD